MTLPSSYSYPTMSSRTGRAKYSSRLNSVAVDITTPKRSVSLQDAQQPSFGRIVLNLPMFAAATIADEIVDLKRQRHAILLAHHYQEAEIQELADVVGDSLELARKAREFSGDVIAFCGVWFMAETAKVLNPSLIVVVPDREARCSL